MKLKPAFRSVRFVTLLLMTIYFCAVSAAVFAKGSIEPDILTQEHRSLLRTDPEIKPDWVIDVPQSETEIFFVSVSQPYDTVASARNDARENARIQVLKYYGVFIESRAAGRSSMEGTASAALEVYVNREEEILSYAQSTVSEVSTVRYYTEVWLNSDNKEEYVAYALHSINRQKTEDDIANFAKNTSQRYALLLQQRDTLKAALESYTVVIKALQQNPLHRITAYYDSPNGRVGMYEYALVRINELAGSLSIEPVQTQMIYETETLNTPVRLMSSIIPSTGYLNCTAVLYGTGRPVISPPFPNASNDPFVLANNPLPSGSYNVQIEILLYELTEGIVDNVTGSFSFVVTPLNPLLETKDAMEAGIKRAVDSLAAGLTSQTETVIRPFTLTGTDIPTGLSRYLSERIRNDAINNRQRKYRVVDKDSGRAELTEFFTRRNNRVDVILELSTPAGKGSQSLALSVAMLNEWGISIEPEEYVLIRRQTIDQIMEVITEGDNHNRSTQSVNIHAQFNSPSMTYLHREPLVMTIKADRNCYFEIIHIDAGNRMKVIYPVSPNDNNYLRANTAMTVFGNQNHIMYGPYGAETILIAASVEPLNGLNSYIESWAETTEEAIRQVIGANMSGIKLYTITMLQPDEEYEYGKPENMIETARNLHDDITRQGGIFFGTNISGYYILNNIRGSYRIPEDSPDRIQFASYNLDNYTGGQNAGVRARGAGFNFSFAIPENVARAVRMVRSGIEDKGGTFSGNEQQGSFRVSGIVGQYQVSDVVKVTITEKPFIVPNSLIENEVKNYFGR